MIKQAILHWSFKIDIFWEQRCRVLRECLLTSCLIEQFLKHLRKLFSVEKEKGQIKVFQARVNCNVLIMSTGFDLLGDGFPTEEVVNDTALSVGLIRLAKSIDNVYAPTW